MPQLLIDELAQASVEGRKARLNADKIRQIMEYYKESKK